MSTIVQIPRFRYFLQYDSQETQMPTSIFGRFDNLVRPVWQFLPPPIFQPGQHFHHNHQDPAAMILYNNVPQSNHYQENGTTFYRSGNVHMASASSNHMNFTHDHRLPTHNKKQQRKTSLQVVEDSPHPKDEKRLRRHNSDLQRRTSGFYEKQSDEGSRYQSQQQRHKHRKSFGSVLMPMRSSKNEIPLADCSATARTTRTSAILKEHRVDPIKKDAPVSPACGLKEEQLYNFLIDFIVSPEDLFPNGYPDLDKVKNQVRVWRQSFGPYRIPKNGAEIEAKFGQDQRLEGTTVERICVRCNARFFVTEHGYLTKQRCCYHWGKIACSRYTCCENIPGSEGCTSSKHHVWNGTVAGLNESLEGFVSTKPCKKAKDRKVFALDCEMCYTVKGLELCRVTILGFDGAIVYDHFVKPEKEVVDYNTRFSGVTESDVNGPLSKTFDQVQSDILNLVSENSILVGHALDNDLRVLKLVHSKIVDTSLVFPHERGFPFKYSLKNLMSTYLQKEIQTSELGHSPYEDALSCLELIFFKVRSHHGQKYINLIQKNLRW